MGVGRPQTRSGGDLDGDGLWVVKGVCRRGGGEGGAGIGRVGVIKDRNWYIKNMYNQNTLKGKSLVSPLPLLRHETSQANYGHALVICRPV